MPKNINITIPEYGSYSPEQMQEEYGENWLKAIDQLNGTVEIPEYGTYSYSDLQDAYGDNIPEALEQLSGKKKEETQEPIPEDTVSVSEDISLASPETDEGVDLTSGFEDVLEGEVSTGDVDPSVVDTDYENVPYTVGEVETQKGLAEMKVTPEYLKKELGIDPLKFSQEDLTELVTDSQEGLYDSDVAPLVSQIKQDDLNALTDTFLQDKEASIMEANKDMGEELAKDMARDSIRKEAYNYALASTGLNEEEHVEFDNTISERYNALNGISDLKNEYYDLKAKLKDSKITPEEKLELQKRGTEITSEIATLKEVSELASKKIGALRENEDRAFTDAEGNVNKELKEDVQAREDKFQKEYKSDYAKITSRLIQEKAKKDALVKRFDGEEFSDLPFDVQELTGSSRVFSDEVPVPEGFFGERQAEFDSYKEAYQEADKNIKALSRLALLNEDPAAVERGWGDMGDVPYLSAGLEGAGELFSSAGETLYEEVTGLDYVSDKDFRSTVVPLLNQEGLKLTKEQSESGESTILEDIGDALGMSGKIALDLAVTKNIFKTVKSISSVAKLVDRTKSFIGNEKVAKFAGGLLEESLAFELANEATSASMGAGEYAAESGFEGLVKGLSKSKYGKFLKYIDSYATRYLKNVAVGGTGAFFGEYTGEFIDQGVKNGFFTEEQYKNTFGEGDEAFRKAIITGALTFGMKLPSAITESFKSDLKTEEGKELLEDYNEAQASNEKAESDVKAGAEVLETEEGKVVEDLTEEEEIANINKERESLTEESAKITEELSSMPKSILNHNKDKKRRKELYDRRGEIYTREKELYEKEKKLIDSSLGLSSEVDSESDVTNKEASSKTEDEVKTDSDTFIKEEGIESEEEIGDIKDLESFVAEKTPEPKTEETQDEAIEEEPTVSIEEEEKAISEMNLPREKKKVAKIAKAIKKVAPGVEFVFHKTQEDYNNSSDLDVSDSRGYRDGDKVHINLSSIKDNTSFHEAIHPVLDAVFEKNPETYNKLVGAMKTDPEFSSYFEKAQQDYTGENTQVNEALTEMMADVASGKFNESTSVYQKVKDFIKEILTKLNLRQSDFNIDLNKEVDVRQFAETIGKALAKGKELTFEKESKLVQEKISNLTKEGLSSLSESIKGRTLDIYSKINNTKEITKEGVKKAYENSKEFASSVSKSLSKAKDATSSFVNEVEVVQEKVKARIKESVKSATNKASESVSKTKESAEQSLVDAVNKTGEVLSEAKDKASKAKDSTVKTVSDVNRQAAKAKKVADKAYEDFKGKIKGKALDIYKSINKTAEITKDGFLKAAIQSRQFLDELIKASAKGITKVEESIIDAFDTMKKVLIATSITMSTATGVSPAVEGYIDNGVDGMIFNVLETNPWVMNVTEGTELGGFFEVAYQRTGFKTGKLKGGEEVSIEDSKKGKEVTKEVVKEEGKTEDSVSEELKRHVANNTKFFISDKKIALTKRLKPRGYTSNIENTFAADSGFVYYAAPNVGSAKNGAYSVDALAVAQFQLDGNISDNQSFTGQESEYTKGHEGHYMHKNNDAILKVSKNRNDYVPVFEKLGDNKVKVKYKRFNDLKPGERVMSPLRQFKYSEIAWGKETQADDFAAGMKALPLKKGVKYPYPGKKGGNQTDIIFGKGGSGRYGLYEGVGAVFIFTDSKGVTFVKEFNGSANQVAAKGKDIIKEFGVKPEDLTVGYHDVGSFSARPLAEKGKVGTDLYTGKNLYNPDPWSGGALYYPPESVNFQKKGDSAKKKFLKAKGFSDTEIEKILSDFENKKKAEKSVKKSTVKGQPTKTVIRKNTGQGSPKKITITEKGFIKRIIQAQNKAGKQTLKSKVELFKELAKELGYKVIPRNIGTRKAISLMKELNGLDANSTKLNSDGKTKVEAFVEKLDKVLSDKVASDRKSSLSKRVKRIAKKAKKFKGVRSDIANRLKNINLNKIEDVDAYNELVDALEDSFKVKESMAEKKITSESLQKVAQLEKEQQETNELIIKDSYENSVLKAQGLTFEEYKAIQNREGDKAALKKQQDKTESKTVTERKQEFKNQLQRLKDYAESVKTEDVLSDNYRRSVQELNRVLNGIDVESLSVENLNAIYNSIEEMINFDSNAGVTKVTNLLKGSKIGESLARYNKSKGGVFSKSGKMAWSGMWNTNWDNFISGVTKKIEYAQEFTAKLMSEWDVAQAKVDTRMTPLEEKLNKISERRKGFVNTGVTGKGFQKIGVVSELLQHNLDATDAEIEEDFELKKKDIKKNIEADKAIMESELKYSPEYNAAARRSKALQEALDIVNEYDTKADLQKAVDAGKVLSKPELEYYNEVKSMFAELEPELREALYMNTGQDLKSVENYTATYKKSYKKVSDLKNGDFGNTISTKNSGRTIERVKPTGNTYNNYDFRETSLSGLREMISDVETLPSKVQVAATLNSKGFNSMFPKGSKTQAAIEDYVSNIADARSSRNPSDTIKQNRVIRAARSFYSGLKGLPLKNTRQYIQQTIPIAVETLSATGVRNMAEAGRLLNSSDPEVKAKVEEIMSRSQTKNRTALGDAQLDKSSSIMMKALKNAYSPKGEGNLVSKFYAKLAEDALSIGDHYAARLTFLSAYLQELRKQGKDFSADISNETISKADTTTNRVNNVSDVTKTKQAFKDNNRLVKDMFFLYKSFAMNQSATMANAIPKIIRGDKDAMYRVAGGLMSLAAFHTLADLLRGGEKYLAEELFGFNDEDALAMITDKDEEFAKLKAKKDKKVADFYKNVGKKTMIDLTTGWMPDIADDLAKKFVNVVADQFVTEEELAELKERGLEKEDFIKMYDQEPGFLGLGSGQLEDLYNASKVVLNPELPDKIKNPARVFIFSSFFQEGNSNKISKKLLYQAVKVDKALRKEMEKASK